MHSKTNLLSSERLINVAMAATPSALNPYSISLGGGRSGRRREVTRGEDKEPRGEAEKKTQHTRRRRKRRENRGEKRRSHFKFAMLFCGRRDRGQILVSR